MLKNNPQKAILYSMQHFSGSSPFINHSSMTLVCWMMTECPAILEEFSEKQIRNSLYNLKRKKYIKQMVHNSKQGKMVTLKLTGKGKKLFQAYKIEDVELVKTGKWDGQWRIIIYDVPRRANYARRVFRDKLKELGFFRIQHSVWVYPYDCMDELDLFIEYFKVERYVLKFTSFLANDEELVDYFKKEGFSL